MKKLKDSDPLVRIVQRPKDYNIFGFSPNSRILVSRPAQQTAAVRMIEAVNRVQSEANKGNEFANLLLGNTMCSIEQKIHEFSAKHMPHIDVDAEVAMLQADTERTLKCRLNEAQEEALRKALTSSICLIQGCPGSGKTVLASVILKGLGIIHNRNKEGKMLRQILCCTNKIVAADNIAYYCMKAKMSVIRVTSMSALYDNKGMKEIECITLKNIVANKVMHHMYVDTGVLTEEENDLIWSYIAAADTHEFTEQCNSWYKDKMEKNNGAGFIRNSVEDHRYALTNDKYGVKKDERISIFKRVKNLYMSLERYELDSH